MGWPKLAAKYRPRNTESTRAMMPAMMRMTKSSSSLTMAPRPRFHANTIAPAVMSTVMAAVRTNAPATYSAKESRLRGERSLISYSPVAEASSLGASKR